MFVFTQISLKISANAFWVQDILNVSRFIFHRSSKRLCYYGRGLVIVVLGTRWKESMIGKFRL